MKPQLYQHQEGHLAILYPEPEPGLLPPFAWRFRVHPWQELEGILRSAQGEEAEGENQGRAPMCCHDGARWSTCTMAPWPDTAWQLVQPQDVRVVHTIPEDWVVPVLPEPEEEVTQDDITQGVLW